MTAGKKTGQKKHWTQAALSLLVKGAGTAGRQALKERLKERRDTTHEATLHSMTTTWWHLGSPRRHGGLKKTWTDISPVNRWIEQYQGNSISAVNSQNYQTLVNIADRPFFERSGLVDNGTSGLTKEYRTFVQNIKIAGQLVNCSNTVVTCEIFVISAKEDSCGGADANQSITEQINSGIDMAFQQNASTQYYTQPFTTPKMSPVFRKNWHIVRKRTLHLAPGEVHKFHVTVNYNQLIDNAMEFPQLGTNTANRPQYVGHISKALVIRMMGQVAYNPTTNIAGFAQAKIAYACQAQMTYRSIGTTKTIAPNNAIGTLYPNPNTTGAQAIENPETMAPVTAAMQ